MRLISSKLHDYYDSCINQLGYDTSGNVFIRDPATIKINTNHTAQSYNIRTAHLQPNLNFLASAVNILPFTRKNSKNVNYVFAPFVVLIAGTIYGGIKLYAEYTPSDVDNISQYIYSYDALIDISNTHGFNVIQHPSKWYLTHRNHNSHTTPQNLIAHFTSTIEYMSSCIEHKLVIAVVTNDSITLNCELKSIQFYRVMGAFTIYQELSMYVDGCLSTPGNQIIEINDNCKIEGHGFNKYSFRSPPTKCITK
jgi:hypothetical protein